MGANRRPAVTGRDPGGVARPSGRNPLEHVVAEKRVPHVIDAWGTARLQLDRDEVEAELPPHPGMRENPSLGRRSKPASLAGRERLDGAFGAPAARLHLDEHHGVPGERDEVDLPASGAPVAGEDMVSSSLEVTGRQLLAPLAQARPAALPSRSGAFAPLSRP